MKFWEESLLEREGEQSLVCMETLTFHFIFFWTGTAGEICVMLLEDVRPCQSFPDGSSSLLNLRDRMLKTEDW